MASSYESVPRHAKPRGATPAERAQEFSETQRRLKQEAAARREKTETGPSRPAAPPAPGTTPR